jgi:hypothetical protein
MPDFPAPHRLSRRRESACAAARIDWEFGRKINGRSSIGPTAL